MIREPKNYIVVFSHAIFVARRPNGIEFVVIVVNIVMWWYYLAGYFEV